VQWGISGINTDCEYYSTIVITFTIFNSQYILITCKPDVVLYKALLIVYNTF